MKLKLFAIPVLVLFISSCQVKKKEEVNAITYENKYRIEFPTFLKERFDLNDEADIQYGNNIREFYSMVLNDTDEEFEGALVANDLEDDYDLDLDGYSSLILDTWLSGPTISPLNDSDRKDIVINGLPAKMLHLEALNNDIGINIYYLISIVKGKKDYYQIWTWTLLDRKEKLQERMEEIIYSFEEL